MEGLLVDSLDEKLKTQAEYFQPACDYLSEDPYDLWERPLPPMPPADASAAFLVFDEGLILLQRSVPEELNIRIVWELIARLEFPEANTFSFVDYPDSESQEWRLAVVKRDGLFFVWAEEQGAVAVALSKLERAFLGLIPIALITAVVGGWEIGRRTLRPVLTLAERMREIDAAGLDRRINEAGATSEIRELIRNHNRMLDRLESQFHQASRFSADAAHELNTPLTVMQSEVEARLRCVEDSPADLRFCESLLTEIMRLKAMGQKLLLLARCDNGQMKIAPKEISLSELVVDLWEDIPLINPELAYEAEICPGLMVNADADLLRLLVQNLLVNAVRYNQPMGWVRTTLRQSGEDVQLTVANASRPIEEAQAGRIFDRFFRVDASRTSATGGTGLGLSLAREIAQVHQAELKLSRNGGGVVAFSLRMPCTRLASINRPASGRSILVR